MTDEPQEIRSISQLIAENAFDDTTIITDTTNGLLLVEKFGDLVRYAVDTGRWFAWNGVSWAEDSEESLKVFALTQGVIRERRIQVTEANGDDEDARNRALNLVAQQESVRKRRAMLDVASADPRIQVQEEDFDVTPNEITTPNVVINLDTLNTRRSKPEDMNSRCCAVPYDEKAESPLLDQFLETFLPDPEDQRFVWALLGNSLRVGNDRRLFPIFWGPTTSGKSQLFAALHKLLGGYICSIGSSVFRGNLDDKPRPDLVNAMFTRIAYATEASKNWALHADQIKRLTGGDVLPYRNLFKGIVNKKPRFTPMIVTNEFPRITAADWPTKRRILAIHFDVSLDPSKEDPDIKRRFLADDRTLQAILARLIAGAADDILTDVSNIPKKYVLATMNARGDMDHTDEFLAWMAEEGYLLDVAEDTAAYICVKASELHSAYAYWLKKFGDDVDRKDQLSLKGLNASLREKGWQSKPSAGTRWVGKRLSENVPMWVKM